LLALIVVALTGCGTTSSRVSAPQPPQRPSLPTKPGGDSVAQFGCPRGQKTTIDIEACDVLARMKLNARFNETVAALWPRLDAKSKREFANGQRLWSRFVDDECDLAYRMFLGGTEAPVAAGWCSTRLTRARVKDVSGMLALYSQGD